MLAMTAYTGVAAAQTWSPEQQEIWRLEEQQWRMAAAKDLSWIETMVHPNLNFWQSDQPMPRGRASLARWARYDSTNSTVREQELFPISVTITGNVAVAQYRYQVASENYKKERETVTGRYTDVFIRDGNRWLFITWAGGDDPKN
jgi:ketosteroid isomerase-like protein